jgi:hypothetical protein
MSIAAPARSRLGLSGLSCPSAAELLIVQDSNSSSRRCARRASHSPRIVRARREGPPDELATRTMPFHRRTDARRTARSGCHCRPCDSSHQMRIIGVLSPPADVERTALVTLRRLSSAGWLVCCQSQQGTSSRRRKHSPRLGARKMPGPVAASPLGVPLKMPPTGGEVLSSIFEKLS